MSRDEEKQEDDTLDGEYVDLSDGNSSPPVEEEAEIEETETLSDEETSDNDDEDTRMGASEEDDDDETEQKSKRTKKRKNKRRRENRKKYLEVSNQRITALETQNLELQHQLHGMHTRVGTNELTVVEERIHQNKINISEAKQLRRNARSEENRDNEDEAEEIIDQLEESHKNLLVERQGIQQRAQQQPQQPSIPVTQQVFANDFITEFDWWDQNGKDPDSRTVNRLDLAITQEGYDPTTEEYWEELRDRMSDRLPHRFRDPEKSPSRPPKFRSNGRDQGLKKNQFFVSKERKQAMIEAGLWEDPDLRKETLYEYKKFDEQMAAEQRR